MTAKHDPNRVLLGTNRSSDRVLTSHDADPASFPAGLAVRRSSTNGLQLESDGTAALIGVSAGKDLSDAKRTSVYRRGLQIPLRQKKYPASGVFTITAFADAVGDSAVIADVSFVGGSGAATPGEATFQAASSESATATSLAAQINAHPVVSLLVTATADDDEVLVVAEPGAAGNDIVFEWVAVGDPGGATSGDGFLAGGKDGVAEQGQTVYVNDDGLGCDENDEDATETSAVYSAGSGVLVGEEPFSGGDQIVEHPVGLIDMRGGL
jgi:hypothetical protein